MSSRTGQRVAHKSEFPELQLVGQRWSQGQEDQEVKAEEDAEDARS